MTIQQILDNFQPNQKTQAKSVTFQQGNGQPYFSGDILYIRDYDNSGNVLGDLDLTQFPNIRSINFNYNIRANSLENIDVSKNSKLSRIIIGQNNCANSFQNASCSCILIVKERHLDQIAVRYYQYNNNYWVEKNEHLRKQGMIPYILFDENEKKVEQLATENEQLKQQIAEKDQQIADLKRKTEQTPTLEQFQELNSIALSEGELNFDNLKQELKRLKLKDFTPYFREQKENFTQLVTNAQNKANDLKAILELFLDTNKKIIEQGEGEDAFAKGQLQGQLTTCQALLQTKLTQQELKNLLNKQKGLLKLEKQEASLQQG